MTGLCWGRVISAISNTAARKEQACKHKKNLKFNISPPLANAVPNPMKSSAMMKIVLPIRQGLELLALINR